VPEGTGETAGRGAAQGTEGARRTRAVFFLGFSDGLDNLVKMQLIVIQ
jgi:hypothetical protein